MFIISIIFQIKKIKSVKLFIHGFRSYRRWSDCRGDRPAMVMYQEFSVYSFAHADHRDLCCPDVDRDDMPTRRMDGKSAETADIEIMLTSADHLKAAIRRASESDGMTARNI